MEPQGYIISLVQRIRKKDVEAMRVLYDRYARDMLATSYRITNDLQESEDILQEAFLSSFQKIHQLKEDKIYAGWLRKIVVNKSLGSVRNRIHFEDLEITDDLAEAEAEQVSPPEYTIGVLQKAIQDLPEGCRQVFTCYLLENYKHKEIAEHLGITVSTSKSQYRYAIKLLRDKLKKINHD